MSRSFIYSHVHTRFAYFDLFDWFEVPFTLAAKTRWQTVTRLAVTASSAGQNVVNIAADMAQAARIGLSG